jgi:hypothetical protein
MRYLFTALAALFLSTVISFITISLFVSRDENPVVGGLFWLFALLAAGTLIVPLSLAITAELVEREIQPRHFSWANARKRFLLAMPIPIGPLYAVVFVLMRVADRRPRHWFEILVLLNCVSAVFAYLALRISNYSFFTPSPARLIEFLKVVMGSSAVGFFIAVLQTCVTFGVRGVGLDTVRWACLLMAIFGGMLGILTGLVVYYVILQSHVTVKQLLIITVGSLIVGCLGGIIFDWYFIFATPFLSMYIAWGVKGSLFTRAA